MSEAGFSYVIETEIPQSYFGNLFDFIYNEYLTQSDKQFANISRGVTEGEPVLSFNVLGPQGEVNLSVEIRGSIPIKMKIAPVDPQSSAELVRRIEQDMIIVVESFEDGLRKNALYFAWEEGERIIPERKYGSTNKTLNRLFLETQIMLFVLFLTVGLFLFVFIGWLAPVVLLAVQFAFVFYSNKFIARTGDWHINESNPTIHLLQVFLPMQEQDAVKKAYSDGRLLAMKKEVYEQTILKNGDLDCTTASETFGKYGFKCSPENLVAKRINVYALVKKAAGKFGFPMPEIVVSNTLLPNAAASGPSPSRAVVLITTGLLTQLDEDEIISILGHEFGHLKGRDPLYLYGITGAEFMFRFYVLFPLFPIIFTSLLFLVYFWFIMTLIYFVAKFFEARADLISAMVMGQPQVLARALEKIGFRRLMFERVPQYRLQEWVSLDPHPPIYFRVERLEKLAEPVHVKHPLVQSAKDVVAGFLANLRAA